jgi:hypothetical protein
MAVSGPVRPRQKGIDLRVDLHCCLALIYMAESDSLDHDARAHHLKAVFCQLSANEPLVQIPHQQAILARRLLNLTEEG